MFTPAAGGSSTWDAHRCFRRRHQSAQVSCRQGTRPSDGRWGAVDDTTTVSQAGGGALIERHEELTLLDRLVLEVRAGGSAVVEITGPLGCGRSALLEAAMARAELAGL